MHSVGVSVRGVSGCKASVSTSRGLRFGTRFHFVHTCICFRLMEHVNNMPLVAAALRCSFDKSPSCLHGPHTGRRRVCSFMCDRYRTVGSRLNGGNDRAHTGCCATLTLRDHTVLCTNSVTGCGTLGAPGVIASNKRINVPSSVTSSCCHGSLATSRRVVAGNKCRLCRGRSSGKIGFCGVLVSGALGGRTV